MSGPAAAGPGPDARPGGRVASGSPTTALVTGATSGIGKAVAAALADRGHRVLMVGRSRERGQEAVAGIRSEEPDAEPELLLADLGSQAQVRALASRVEEATPRLDVLVNNAGTFTRRRRTTEDGVERQLAVNYLAPFLLTNLLRPLLAESSPARIVNVSSMEHRLGRIRFSDLQLEHGYSGGRAYRQSKLAGLLFTRELARRLRGTGVVANAVHPGVAYTKLVDRISRLSRLVRPLLKTPEEAAEGPVHLATSPEVEGVSGRYFRGTREVCPARRARDPATARRLWRRTEELVGLS